MNEFYPTTRLLFFRPACRILCLLAVLAAIAAAAFLAGSPGCKNPVVPPDRLPHDTTSHSFVWRIDTLGDGNSSILNDVAIIDQNNIWAVGEIYLKDSTGQFSSSAYGFAVWDGIRWSLRRYQVMGPNGPSNLQPRGIFAFGANDIWFASGGVFHWNGSSMSPFWINDFPGNPNPILGTGQTAEKLWGTSGNDLFAVGLAGAVAHFDGVGWQKLEGGTSLTIRDIWGAGQQVLAVASDPFSGPDRKILSISTSSVTILSDSGISQPLNSIWFDAGGEYYVVGSGIYQKRELREPAWSGKPLDLTPYYSNAIRGNSSNDVFVVGAFADVLHFNGSTWHQYTELRQYGSLYAVAAKNNLVVAVGFVGDRAAAVIGRRQQ